MDCIRIGTSGWQYRHWRGPFYPDGLRQADWFAHYSDVFTTVELNTTFYHLPKPHSVAAWHDHAPDGFRYALKLSRYATHIKRLRDPDDTLTPFLQRVEALKSYLGPILVQLPPRWHPDAARLDSFLSAAPRRHRWAIEFRDRAWLCDEIFDILAAHGAALCIHDMIPDHPRRLTTDWTYLRFHGDHYRGCYGEAALVPWARFLRQQQDAGRASWVYFNNDESGYATMDARSLRRMCDR